MLGAFFDDSGTHSSSKVTAIGGLLGTDAQWDEFEKEWTRILANPLPGKPPLKQFHLAACRGRHDEFKDYSEAERNHLTYRFRRVILDIGFVTIASAVDREAWIDLVVDDLAETLGNPEGFCLIKCMSLLTSTIRFRKPGEKIAVFLDRGIKQQLAGWAEFYVATTPEIVTLAYAPVGAVVALQGADMIATETFHYVLEWLRNREKPRPNPHFLEFMNRELSAGFICTRSDIETMIANVRSSPQ